jgi:hypothetical protein
VVLVSIAVALFVIAGVAMIVARRPLAEGQAIVFGGSMVPGCVVAEAVVLFVIAALMIVAYRLGLFR